MEVETVIIEQFWKLEANLMDLGDEANGRGLPQTPTNFW